MQITVRPPWYNTVWAYLIYVALIWFAIQEGLRLPFKEFAEKRTRKAGGRATSRTAKASTNEKRDAGNGVAKQKQ